METQVIATEIVKTLRAAGFIAYFAGGWVRDFIMSHPSDDIDIATDAPTEKIVELFPNTVEVGIAFGVVIVVKDGNTFEVATFRKDIDYVGGRRPTRIEPTTPQGDALRRDFTINGMFYDPIEDVIHDFVHGQEDIHHEIIQTIGDPYERFEEDRLRMIRAVRFSAKFGFRIDLGTQEAIQKNAETLLPAVSMERIWNELCKMRETPRFDQAIMDMHRFGLLQTIFSDLQGTHLNDIKHQVSAFQFFPKETPTICYLMEIFPHYKKEEIQQLTQYLRTSAQEKKYGWFLHEVKTLVGREKEGKTSPDFWEWSHAYADPRIDVCLHVIAAKMPDKDQFLKKHDERQKVLSSEINRIREKCPVVNAKILQEHGVSPGRNMGAILHEAEKLSINENIQDPDRILLLLKKQKAGEFLP